MLMHPVYRALPSVAGALPPARPFLVRETTQVTPPKPRLLDRVRAALRARHYSRRTEEAYVAWVKRYIFFFHAKRHPAEMGAPEVTRFLSSLAVASARGWPRHSHRSGAAGASGREHDDDLHARAESWPGGRAESGGPNVLPMTPPAASSAMCAKIRGRAAPRISARQRSVIAAQDRGAKGPKVSRANRRNVEAGRVGSQRLPLYADLRILWPNSS
jgi:hypothetical protein